MAYTLTNLQDDIKGYTEVGDNVFTSSVLNTLIKNAENKIYREVDSDQDRHYATSNLIIGNRYVTIPADLRLIRYVQLKDSDNNQYYLEQRDTTFIAEYYSTPGTSAGLYPNILNFITLCIMKKRPKMKTTVAPIVKANKS